MANFALIHGASSDAWYWHLVVPELQRRGHGVVAPDLPSDDDGAGFSEYADAVVEALGDRSEVVVVAQSLGGFTGPIVCARRPVELLVLVAAMVPRVGEAPADWWEATGWVAARAVAGTDEGGAEVDAVLHDFFHDVPDAVVAEAMARGERHQSSRPFEEPWPVDRWPDVETRFLLCRDDRFFPASFQRRVVAERLGLVPDEMDGGHLPALSRPAELAARLDAYWQHRAAPVDPVRPARRDRGGG